MKNTFCLAISLFILSISMHSTAQTSENEWGKRQVKKWFKKQEWLGGLQLQPHKTVNKAELARQYQRNKTYWDEAFAYLKSNDLQTLPVGRHAVDSDNVYSIVTENRTKDYDSTMWESHKKYVDLQYVISGEEKIGASPLNKLTVTKQYDDAKDIMNYSGEGKVYDAVPGTFFLFFPSDAHRPNISPGDKKTDKKIVIKIKYTE